jgi:transcriptional regulator with XRE-family HTH domain
MPSAILIEAMPERPPPNENLLSDTASELGPRLRAIRLRRGLGLRELARRVDLAPSSISQIETGKTRPSVSTLYALASEFGVTVEAVLFGEASLPDAEEPDTNAAQLRPVPEPALSVQRADERPAIALPSGVRWERLMFWADEDVEFIEAIYEPGGSSSLDDSFVRHNGHEFGHVLSGSLRLVVGFEEVILGPGDSITFPSSTPHRLSNDGTETARAIWVVRGRRGADQPTEPDEIEGLKLVPAEKKRKRRSRKDDPPPNAQ